MSAAANELRTKQAPIKEEYRADPSKALVTLRSSGSLDGTSIACKLSTGAAVKEAVRVAGLHPAAGGPDPNISGELCSGDMLLDALVACAGVTLKAVATALAIPVLSGNITAEGDLDFRGTLGVDRNAPVGITGIRMVFDLAFGKKDDGSEVSDVDVERLGKLTERYCVVLQTLVNKPEVVVRVEGKSNTQEQGIEKSVMWAHKIER